MKIINENLVDFEKQSSFYGKLNLIATVKSFQLQEIRARYITSKKSGYSNSGSVERRKPAIGGVVSLVLENGTLIAESVLARLKEPRGIDICDRFLAVSSDKKVFIIKNNGDLKELSDEWFSYIHTVQFSPENSNLLLVSSSGFDLILEYDHTTNIKTFEWLAWENGFNKSIDPKTGETVYLTRSKKEYEQYLLKNQSSILITEPSNQDLPTAKRAAFINSVTYDSNKKLLATFFHEGKVYKIDRFTGVSEPIISGLKNPHGGHSIENKIVATSTASGELIIQDESQKRIINFSALDGKPQELSGLEWVQNTVTYKNLFISIDSNRTNFVIIDPDNRKYDIIPYNKDWAIQDFIVGEISDDQKKRLSLFK
ncbi:MAG: hypothetical protein ABJR05_13965 [Balneola sp.]